MTAGRGVLHSEMPQGNGAHAAALAQPAGEDEDDPGALPGPAAGGRAGANGEGASARLCRADRATSSMATAATIRCGCSDDAVGRRVEQEVPPGYRGFVYVLEGGTHEVGGKEARARARSAWFEPGEGELSIAAEEEFRGAAVRRRADRRAGGGLRAVCDEHPSRKSLQAFKDYQAGQLVAQR